MLQDLTAAKIDHGLAKLALDQMKGEAPPPGQVSLADLAKRAGVSEKTILNIERMALAKIRLILTKDRSTIQDPLTLSYLNRISPPTK